MTKQTIQNLLNLFPAPTVTNPTVNNVNNNNNQVTAPTQSNFQLDALLPPIIEEDNEDEAVPSSPSLGYRG